MSNRIVWVHGIGVHEPGYSIKEHWQENFNQYLKLQPEDYLEVCWDTVFKEMPREGTRSAQAESKSGLSQLKLTPQEHQDTEEVSEQLKAILLARSSALAGIEMATPAATRGSGSTLSPIMEWSEMEALLASSSRSGWQEEDTGTRGLASWLLNPDDYLGDFMKYLAVRRIRNAIKEKFKEVLRPLLVDNNQISVVSHSWGTIVAYDSLLDLEREVPGLKVANLFTLGSPLWMVRWLLEDKSGRKPGQTGNWLNIHAKSDLVGSWLSPAFKVDKEFEVLNFGGHDAHGSYFEAHNEAVQRDLIAQYVLGASRSSGVLEVQMDNHSVVPTLEVTPTVPDQVVANTQTSTQSVSSEANNIYALLIGVDCYLPNRLSDGSSYLSLRGCVRDINHVEEFLKRKLGMQESQLTKLTASTGPDGKPSEPSELWPTYENMVAAFKRLTEKVQAGDQVYIHYSGHGGRTATLFPERKGQNGHDEALVPTNIGDPNARYLRDIELGILLNQMVYKGLIVTVVLDSCHSGGATRGGNDVAVRGLNTIDKTPRPSESLVASKEELAQQWDTMTESARSQGATRGLRLGSGWLPETKGYTLLAACLETESAYEFAFDGKERNGALTYWLLKSLEEISINNVDLSYKMLHDRLLAKIHSQFERQTPQLQGEGDRVIFGSDRIQPQYGIGVLKIQDDRILLGAGQVHGLRKGAQFVIYPNTTTNFNQLEQRQALANLIELGADTSWSKVEKLFKTAPIEQGSQAVLVNPGSIKLVRKVRLVIQERDPGDSTKAFSIPVEEQEGALNLVRQAFAGNGWVEESYDGEAWEYHVAVSEQRQYEIWDRTGKQIGLRPEIAVGTSTTEKNKSAQEVVKQLVHLTKYHATLELDNNDPMSPLAGKLKVELTGYQKDYDPADKPQPQPFDDPGSTPVLQTGEWAFMRIQNNYSAVLKLAVLDLQPDYGITQVYPSGQESFITLDPGKEIVLPLQAYLPEGYTDARDIIKVFATLGGTDFHWLELPALDKPLRRTRSITRGGALSSLEQLQLAIAGERPVTRNLNPAAYPSKEWVVAQLEVRMQTALVKS